MWQALDDAFLSSGAKRLTVIHGGARGADTLAHLWCQSMGRKVIELVFEADWHRYGRAAGPMRNQKMVEALRDWGDIPEPIPPKVLAFYNEGSPNVGTMDCVSRARKAGYVVVEYTQRRG